MSQYSPFSYFDDVKGIRNTEEFRIVSPRSITQVEKGSE